MNYKLSFPSCKDYWLLRVHSWNALWWKSLPHPRLHLLLRDICIKCPLHLTSIWDTSEGLSQIQSPTYVKWVFCCNCTQLKFSPCLVLLPSLPQRSWFQEHFLSNHLLKDLHFSIHFQGNPNYDIWFQSHIQKLVSNFLPFIFWATSYQKFNDFFFSLAYSNLKKNTRSSVHAISHSILRVHLYVLKMTILSRANIQLRMKLSHFPATSHR